MKKIAKYIRELANGDQLKLWQGVHDFDINNSLSP